MPIDIPESAEEVENRAKADVQRELAGSNPFGKNHWLGAVITGAAFRIYDFYLQLLEAIKQSFFDTATGDFLKRWAAIFGITINPASKSNGVLVATGVAGSFIPLGTTFAVQGVGNFISTAAVTITDQSINVLSLTRSGTTVTVTTESDHGLANNVEVDITLAASSDYNITSAITVTGSDTFQYEIAGSPANEPASNAVVDFASASVPVQSEDFGSDVNVAAGTEATVQSPIVGVDDTLTVDFGQIGGGTDIESTTSFRNRFLDRVRNPVSLFNVAAIKAKVKEVEGVTRVFVEEVTPAVGQVTVYFMRDNDENPIPSGSEVIKTKNKLLEIKPATTADADVIVEAPTPVTVDFTFLTFQPNTDSMKNAITANLGQFFEERTTVGVNVDEDAYRSAIFNTVDSNTGQIVSTFILSEPLGDITINTGEIGILGTVTFP